MGSFRFPEERALFPGTWFFLPLCSTIFYHGNSLAATVLSSAGLKQEERVLVGGSVLLPGKKTCFPAVSFFEHPFG